MVGGMTRSSSKTALLAQLGAEPILCDVFDRDALIQAVRDFHPDVILNELTDLPDDVTKIGDHAEPERAHPDRGQPEPDRGGTAERLAEDPGPDRRLAAARWAGRPGCRRAGAFRSRRGRRRAELRPVLRPGTYNEQQIPAEPRVQIDRAAERTVELLDSPRASSSSPTSDRDACACAGGGAMAITFEGVLADGARALENCSIAMTMDVIGTRSSMLILREAFYGTTRFDDFARRTKTTEAIVAARLKAADRYRVVRRTALSRAGQANPPRVPPDRQGQGPLPGGVRAHAVGQRAPAGRGRRAAAALSNAAPASRW